MLISSLEKNVSYLEKKASLEKKKKLKKLYFQPYKKRQPNILVIGPVPGKIYNEIIFPILIPKEERKIIPLQNHAGSIKET